MQFNKHPVCLAILCRDVNPETFDHQHYLDDAIALAKQHNARTVVALCGEGNHTAILDYLRQEWALRDPHGNQQTPTFVTLYGGDSVQQSTVVFHQYLLASEISRDTVIKVWTDVTHVGAARAALWNLRDFPSLKLYQYGKPTTWQRLKAKVLPASVFARVIFATNSAGASEV